MYHSFRKSICIGMAFCMIAPPQMLLAQQPASKDRLRGMAIKLIPKDATSGMIAHPRSALTAPSMEAIPHEIITAFGIQELGFDPMDIELAVAAVRALPQRPPEAAIGLKFRKPISLDDLSPKLTRGTTEDEIKGKPYLRNEGGLGFYAASDTVLLAGSDSMIRSMLQRQGTPNGNVHKHLMAGPASDLQLVVALEDVRPMLEAQIQQTPPLPAGLEALKRLPEHTEAIDVRMSTSPLNGEIALHAIDDGSAVEIEKIFGRALRTGKLMAQEAARYNITGEGQVEQASLAYSNRMIDMMFDKIKPGRDGTKVMLGGEAGNQAEVMVIAGLVALLLPAVQAAREAARRNMSSNQGRQIILSMLNYESATQRFPAHAIYDKAKEKPLLSWRVQVLPYLEQTDLYDEFHLDEPWDSPHNKKLISRMPEIYAKPGEDPTEGKTHFLGITGEDACFFKEGAPRGRRIGDITDGTSKSIAVVEADDSVIWTKPEDLSPDLDNPAKGLGNLRPGNIFTAIFCDGHVTMVSKGIAPEMLKAMFTVNAGDIAR